MTLFAELESLVSNEIDTMMGEITRIEPRVKGTVFAGSADSSRSNVEIVGIIDFNPVVIKVKDEGAMDGFQPVLSGDKIHVSYDLSKFSSAAQYPKQDDHIVALQRSGTPKYRITREPDHDGIGRMICVCVPA